MQYIALIYGDPDLTPKHGTPEAEEMMKGYFAANEVYKRDGVFIAGEPLQGVETATSLRIRSGKTETMDGPFAETKERLGGFYIFDCDDLDAALRYAALIPGAKYGTVEVRPILQLG
jgi:hypothetical protein